MSSGTCIKTRGWRLAALWVGLTVGYVALGAVALALGHGTDEESTLWLPTGLALVATLLCGYRMWPGIAVGAILLELMGSDAALTTGTIIAAGTVAEVLLAAWLIRLFIPDLALFDRVRHVLTFVAVIGGCALIEALFVVWAQDAGTGWHALRSWWLSDVAGMLVSTPLLLAWLLPQYRLKDMRYMEMALILLLATVVGVWIFSRPLGEHSLMFLLLPFLIWLALRSGIKGVVTLAFMVALAAMTTAKHGIGPFAGPNLVEALFVVQAFVAVTSVTGLFLVAGMVERAQALEQLHLSDRIMNASPEHISVVGADHIYRRVNHSYEVAHGCSMSELVGRHVKDVLGERVYRELVKPKLDRAFLGEQVQYGAWFDFNGSGRRYMMVNYLPLWNSHGVLDNIAVLSRDVTDIKLAEDKLELAGKVIDNTPEGVMITDANLRILSVNPAFSKTTGYAEHEILGRTPSILSSGRHDTSFYKMMWRTINSQGQWQGEIWNRRKNGDIYPEWLNVSAIHGSDGQIANYAAIFSDLTTQEHVRKRLHSLAYYDALTDLPNRELFNDRLHNALAQAQRHQRQVALMFLDLDNFKQINDGHGHAVGDELLRLGAEILVGCVRESDTVARLGGDEFTLILSEVGKAEDATAVAEKILAAFSAPLQIQGKALFVTTSIGIALYPADGEDVDTLLSNADKAMYAAKHAGRNAWRMFEPSMVSPPPA